MRVLVTGATGFIGSHVLAELRARGHAARALVRASSDVTGLPADVDVVRGGLEDARSALDGIDGVIHLAGIPGALMRRGDVRGADLWRVNVDGTRRLFAAARDAGVRRGVHVTSVWTVLRPDLAAQSPYLRSRLESERAAFEAATDGLEVTCVCPTFVVGAGDRGPNLPGAIVLAFMRGRMPLAPPAGMTWIAAEDAAAAVVAALERGEPRARYVIGAEHVEHRALLGRLATVVGRRPPWGVVPRAVLTTAGTLVDTAVSLARRRLALPLRLGVELLSVEKPIDCSQAHRVLGEPRVPLDDALASAAAWFRAEGYA